MALQKAITTNFGFDCTEAYIMITSSNFDYLNKRAWLNVSTYVSQEARERMANPIMSNEYHVFNAYGTEGCFAKYYVILDVVEKDSGKVVVLDLFGTGRSIITLTEGIDFDGYVVEEGETSDDSFINSNHVSSEAIAIALNDDSTFNEHFEAGVYVNGLVITSKLKHDKYNNLIVSGDATTGFYRESNGVVEKEGDFDKYFSEEAMTTEGASERSNAYIYLKTLEEYKDCIDV